MKTLGKPAAFLLAALLATVCAVPSASADDESVNNLTPWNTSSNRLEHYLTTGNSVTLPSNAITKDDTDYYLVTCSQANYYDPPRFISSLGVDISGPADLDMEVFTIAGGYVSGSYGTTAHEQASLAGLKLSTVVIKVYGYNHAYSDYGFWFSCRN